LSRVVEIEAPNTCSELIIVSQAYLAYLASTLMCCRLLFKSVGCTSRATVVCVWFVCQRNYFD